MKIPQNVMKIKYNIYGGNYIHNSISDINDDSFSKNSYKDSLSISSPQILSKSLKQHESEKNVITKNNINNTKFKNYIPNFSTQNIKNKIFLINKISKLGRIKKNSNKKGKHDKLQQDNIIRHFKVNLMKNMFDYINTSFEINKNCEKKINILQKISCKLIYSISKNDNINWLKEKLKDLFSRDLSSKLVRYEKNYNEKIIKCIYEKNEEKEVIDILDKTVKEMWKAYINNDDNSFPGFKTLKDDIQKMKKNGESDDFISNYERVSKDFEKIFINIKERRKNINKKKKYQKN